MRVAVAPAALLFAALGLGLAFAPRSARAPSLLVLCATLGAFTLWRPPQIELEGALLGCWMSVIATAASVHFVRRLTLFVAVVLSLNAGFWASATIAMSGSRLELLKALPCLFLALPASWVSRRHDSVPVKVVSSWIIAVAVLAVALRLLPVTPGYQPDHME